MPVSRFGQHLANAIPGHTWSAGITERCGQADGGYWATRSVHRPRKLERWRRAWRPARKPAPRDRGFSRVASFRRWLEPAWPKP